MMEDLFPAPENTLTVLSYGAGQDSECLRVLYKHDLMNFRERFAPNDFISVCSDTGDEHEHTYEFIEHVKKDCAESNIPFYHLTSDMGFHAKGWPDLRTFYRTNSTVGSKTFVKSCSERLKVKPIYSFIEKYLEDKYEVKAGDKRGYYEFAARFGKLRVIVGIAKGEESRVADPDDGRPVWMKENVEIIYPLIDLGLDRHGCQELLRSLNEPVPYPSNCVLCPWASLEELEYMRRYLPHDLDDWIQLEKNKLQRFAHLNEVEVTDKKTGKVKIVNRNATVWGKKPLPEVVAMAKEKFKDWTDEQVREFKFSHGHCNQTKF